MVLYHSKTRRHVISIGNFVTGIVSPVSRHIGNICKKIISFLRQNTCAGPESFVKGAPGSKFENVFFFFKLMRG